MNPSLSEISTLPPKDFPVEAMQTRAAPQKNELRVAHVLRKYNPAEWGGTETAIHRLFTGLRVCGVESVVFCPQMENVFAADPLAQTGCAVKRFRSFLPVLGLSSAERQQQIAVGGNLMSLDLPLALWREPGVSVIHTHALGRLGGVAAFVARCRRVPLVVTIHGGFLDLPDAVKESFKKAKRGWEWGKIFGLLLRSRQLLPQADAILTCNPKEAALLREKFPQHCIIVQPHGVSMKLYRKNRRRWAQEAFPQICDREMLLCVGRIDAIKNQRWLVEQAPAMFQRRPQALLVLAGACTDEAYGAALRARIRELGLENRVLLTGGLPPGDARLIGLFQEARVVLLPSVSETFGLVILEAWAAGTAVIASRTSGASALIREGQNGWLFDHGDSPAFQKAVDMVLSKPETAARFAAAGSRLVMAEYDNTALAARMKNLYVQLIEKKDALRRFAG
ncbi:MAG TPA: glycosyltransferase family 4 protein [Verrucomicrobiae bacterium]|nr:glycosyltransferase family 4 protein [Verrucomicrobiae bacterium]